MTRMIRPFLLALVTIALAAACTAQAAAPSVASLEDPDASTDPNASASPSAPTDPQDAFLAFAQCMRDHGIDMPDPEVSDEGGGKFSVGFSAGGPGGGADQAKFKAANEACQPLLENAIGEEGRPELTPEQEQAMLDFARCMREHGIDMPDPGENGMVFNVGGPGQDGSFDREAFEAAQEACQDLLPGRIGGGDGPSLQVGPGGGANGESGPSVKTDEESN
jgi:hypothetical protein